MNTTRPGRQVRKTRGALVGAFNDLVLERRYADIRVADVIRRANVGRSTFYEHFRDKDDLLRESLSGILSILADALNANCDLQRLQFLLDHFRDNLQRARGLINGPSSPQVVGVLADHVAEGLKARHKDSGRDGILAPTLAAACIAEMLLGLVRAWLNDGAMRPSSSVAAALNRGAVALTRSLCSAP